MWMSYAVSNPKKWEWLQELAVNNNWTHMYFVNPLTLKLHQPTKELEKIADNCAHLTKVAERSSQDFFYFFLVIYLIFYGKKREYLNEAVTRFFSSLMRLSHFSIEVKIEKILILSSIKVGFESKLKEASRVEYETIVTIEILPSDF